MENAQVVGVGRQGVGHPILGADFRRQHRPWIDAARAGAKLAPFASQDRVEIRFGDRGDVADDIELVVIEPLPDTIRRAGQLVDVMGRKKRLFRSLLQRAVDVIGGQAGRRTGGQLRLPAHGSRPTAHQVRTILPKGSLLSIA